MKKLFFIVLSGMIWCSCSNNQASSGSTEKTAAEDEKKTEKAGPAQFSATIDGQTFSSSIVDEPLQQVNAAFVVPDKDGKPSLLFHVGDVKSEDDAKVTRVFHFRTARKTGILHIIKGDDHSYNSVYLDYFDGDMSRYNIDDVTIEITEASDARVKGTFSGTFTLSADTPRGLKRSVMVTDGKFDLPMATSKFIPM